MKISLWLWGTLTCLLVPATLTTAPAIAQTTAPSSSALPSAAGLEVLEVRKIWDRAADNAFPDLVQFKGRLYCILREASAHVSPDGILRVIASDDGNTWESVKEFSSKTEDLREFEFCVTPDDRLLIIGAGCTINPDGSRGVHTSYVGFFDGSNWSELAPVTKPAENVWMKRAAVHDGRFFAVGHHCGLPRFSRLYTSSDGERWEVLVDKLAVEAFPNEGGLLSLADGRLMCLQRRDGDPPTALLGLSEAPYTDWSWQDLGVRVGRPTLLQLKDGRILAPIRLLDPMRTALTWIDPKAGTLTEALTLPSGGDGGYTGAVLKDDGVLWVAYYSSHDKSDPSKKASVFLAKVKINP